MENKKTILIIEQEANIANGLKSILQREGYDAIPVFSYYYLKEACEDKNPDLVIINIYIPKELGLNILRKIRASFPNLPIIAMSVYSSSFTKRELSRLGADDFIAKPFDLKYITAKVEELINNKNRYPAEICQSALSSRF